MTADPSTSTAKTFEPTKPPVAEGLRGQVAQHRAAQIISSFENSTTDIQYDYAEDLDDGRGITAGRAGFCSGTGDMLKVLQRYAAIKPDNSLQRYIAPLRAIEAGRQSSGDDSSADTTGLDDLPAAWKQAANADPKFRGAQDDVVDTEYLDPALDHAQQLGITTAAGQMVLFDSIIQHGDGEDADGLATMIHETSARVTPGQAHQAAWLKAFLQVRQHHLEHAADPTTAEDWKVSVDRVRALQSIVDSNNSDLSRALSWTVYGDSFRLPAA